MSRSLGAGGDRGGRGRGGRCPRRESEEDKWVPVAMCFCLLSPPFAGTGYTVSNLSCGKTLHRKTLQCLCAYRGNVKAFRVKGKVTAREWGKKLLIFTFGSTSDREWVLQNQPWQFDGNLFAITPLNGAEQPSTVVVARASFLARIYDLPMACQSKPMLILIARRLGILEAFDPPENNLGSFFRFKVVNIGKSFKRGLKIRVGGGHNFKSCDKYDKNECLAPSDLGSGPTLKVSPLKRVKGPKWRSNSTRNLSTIS
ncbi:hypothetical protein ACS0TY_030198 [Phlomoides rotata]